MFHKRKIAVCTFIGNQMSASLFAVTPKGMIFDTRVESTTFTILKAKYHISVVRLLLSENDTYLKLVHFSKNIIVTRELVINQMREVIPEPIDDAYMDWKTVLKSDNGVSVQVFVVKKLILAPLLKTAHEAGIVIEACEPPSLAMARLTKHIQEAFLLVYPSDRPSFFVAVAAGKVLEVVSIDPLISLDEAKGIFITYVAKLWGVTLTAIAEDMPNPILGLAAKTDFYGEDMNVLTIPSNKVSTQQKRLPMKLFIVFSILLSLVLVFFSFRFLFPNMRKNAQPIIDMTITPSQSPVPTTKSIERSTLRIEVQNGSGTSGLAGEGKVVLEKIGYTDITTANADLFDYEGVIVKGKTIEVAQFVVSDLKSTYFNATVSSTIIDNDISVDAIVILGKD